LPFKFGLRPPPPPPPVADIDPKLDAPPFPPAVQTFSGNASVLVPLTAPDDPPPPIVTTVFEPGVAEIVDVDVMVVSDEETNVADDPVTKTSPAPPPPPLLPKPPPPPPAMTATSMAVTPVGVVHVQLPIDVNFRIVNPLELALEGEHAEKDELKVNDAVEVPPVFVAVTV
jgi:hypothetical protein